MTLYDRPVPARRADRLFRSAWIVALGAGFAAFVACSSEGALQGDAYAPDNTLPTAPPTVRSRDAGAGCDGACDASADVIVPPAADASANGPKNTCETARDIGTMSGDTTGPSLSTKGSCSEWLRLRATENDNGVFGKPMKLTVTVTPPADQDVTLYAFLDPDKDVVVCLPATAVAQSAGAGGVESLELSWGEGSVANGNDDGRTVGLLVFQQGAGCSGDETWSLVVDGNR